MASGTLAVGTLAVLTTAPTALASDHDERTWAARARTDTARHDTNRRAAPAAPTVRVTAYWADTREPRAAVVRGATTRVNFGARVGDGVERVTVVLETAGLDTRKVTVSGVDQPCEQRGTKTTCTFRPDRAGLVTAQVRLRAAAGAPVGRAGWVILTASADGRTGWLPTFGRVNVVATPVVAGTQSPAPRPTKRPLANPDPRPSIGATASPPGTDETAGDAGRSAGDDGDAGGSGGSTTAEPVPTSTAVPAPTDAPQASVTRDPEGAVVALPAGGAAAPGLAELARPRQVTNWPATFGTFGLLLVLVLTMIAVAGNRLGWFEESTAAHRA
ncbi:hypothetical protein [Luedemannella helvata]|uniref:DUF11 domain-containing protein n=1 Tax=Luedemannella helvata TaxID=349315 RepID=A0ABP4VR03_9ACTN